MARNNVEEAAGGGQESGDYHQVQVTIAQPQGPNDPDIYLVVEFKNWAAFDGLGGKLDAVSAQSRARSRRPTNRSRSTPKIRTVLGSKTMQVAELSKRDASRASDHVSPADFADLTVIPPKMSAAHFPDAHWC